MKALNKHKTMDMPLNWISDMLLDKTYDPLSDLCFVRLVPGSAVRSDLESAVKHSRKKVGTWEPFSGQIRKVQARLGKLRQIRKVGGET